MKLVPTIALQRTSVDWQWSVSLGIGSVQLPVLITPGRSFFLIAGCIIHPKASILAHGAPIQLGTDCIVEEGAVIINR